MSNKSRGVSGISMSQRKNTKRTTKFSTHYLEPHIEQNKMSIDSLESPLSQISQIKKSDCSKYVPVTKKKECCIIL